MSRLSAPEFEPADATAWREWLERNHDTQSGVMLILRRPSAAQPGLDYVPAVEEALCYGWINSAGRGVDATRMGMYFAPRKVRSAWARSNKERVERLTAEGRMRPAGLAAIERARENGSWTTLDGAERLEVPPDLGAALDARPAAASNFAAFPPSARKMMLAWIGMARRPETRERRVLEVAAAADRNERARG